MIHFRNMSVLLMLMLMLTAACTGSYRAPVNDVEGGPRYLYDGRMHRVNAGETLYAIAWMYNADYRLLAQINDVHPPYTIHTGQMISVDTRGHSLRPPPAPPPEVRVSPAPAPARVTRAESSSTQAPTSRASQPSTPQPSTPQPSAAPTPRASPPSATPAPTPPPADTPQVASATGPVSSWLWPAKGSVIGGFSSADSGSRGLDIDGQRNDPIHAAADGEVVYAGSGLLRYGNMLIIKHNDRFLSAYAHNDSLLVSEGDHVQQGQEIARMGSTGIDKVMLHFEIRDRGQPVDPLSFLPPR